MEKITDKYYLGSNKKTFILYERKVSTTTGKETYKNIGYISKLENVYTRLLEKEIKEDLSILRNINKITEMINELKEFTIKYVAENIEECKKN